MLEQRSKSLDEQLKDNVSTLDILKNLIIGVAPGEELLGDAIKNTTENYAIQEKVIASLSEEQRKFLIEALELEELLGNIASGGGASDGSKQYLEGTMKAFEVLIKQLEDQRWGLSQTNPLWGKYTEQIEKAKEEMRLLGRELMGLEDVDPIAEGSFSEGYVEFDASIKMVTNSTEKLAKVTQELGSIFEQVFGKDYFLFKQLEGLTSQLNMNLSTLQKAYKVINHEDATLEDKRQARAVAFSEIIGGIGQTIFQNEQIRLENQLQANRDYYEHLIREAERNEEQQNLLREERDRRERELLRKKAENERKAALFDIAVNTARGIVAALGTANIPLSIIIGALGAAQAAVVASQPIPEFKDGVKNFKGGYAILGDGGKNEPIVDRFGNLKGISPSTDTLYNLSPGDSVYSSMDKLPSSVLEKTMMANIMASSNQMKGHVKSKDKGIDAMQFERAIIKSLRKAKFVNNTNVNVDLQHQLKVLKYKGR